MRLLLKHKDDTRKKFDPEKLSYTFDTIKHVIEKLTHFPELWLVEIGGGQAFIQVDIFANLSPDEYERICDILRLRKSTRFDTIRKQQIVTKHKHKWKIFYNHHSEVQEGRYCACGAQEWF